MMLEEYVYNVNDDDRLSQRRRSLENGKKLRFITKIECHIRRIAVQVNDFLIFFDHMNYHLCNKVEC